MSHRGDRISPLTPTPPVDLVTPPALVSARLRTLSDKDEGKKETDNESKLERQSSKGKVVSFHVPETEEQSAEVSTKSIAEDAEKVEEPKKAESLAADLGAVL